MIVVDSVGWLAFFKGDLLAQQYRQYILNPLDILCPTIIVFEVTKKIELDVNRQASAMAAAQLLRTRVIHLDEALATASARTSIIYKLSMGDAIIYTTAITFGAMLISSDSHFEHLPGVLFIPHPNMNLPGTSLS